MPASDGWCRHPKWCHGGSRVCFKIRCTISKEGFLVERYSNKKLPYLDRRNSYIGTIFLIYQKYHLKRRVPSGEIQQQKSCNYVFRFTMHHTVNAMIQKVHQGKRDSKVYGANTGPTWGRQDPGGTHEPCYLGISVFSRFISSHQWLSNWWQLPSNSYQWSKLQEVRSMLNFHCILHKNDAVISFNKKKQKKSIKWLIILQSQIKYLNNFQQFFADW